MFMFHAILGVIALLTRMMTTPPVDPAPTDPAPPDPAKPDPPAPAPDPTKPPVDVTPELQKWVNGLLATERRETESRLAAKRAADEEKAKNDRERDALAARGEFDTVRQGLEKERDDAIRERDAVTERATAYVATLTADHDRMFATLPDNIKKLAPPDTTPIEKRLEWVRNAVEAAGDEPAKPGAPRPGGDNDPKPAGTKPGDTPAPAMTAAQILNV